jgi:hypothetical protein
VTDAEVEAEALEKLEECRRHKAQWTRDILEAYVFAAPHRSHSISSRSTTRTHHDASEWTDIYTSFAVEMAIDFATLVINTFIPEAEKWCQRRPGVMVPDEVKAQIAEKIRAGDKAIFEAISASNFYSEFAKTAVPDVAVGTIGLWIDDQRAHEPIKVQAIPVSELELGLGPFGDLDLRFHVRHTHYKHLKAIIPGIELPKEIAERVRTKPKDKCTLVRGFWRDWSDENNVVWQYVLMVGDKLVKQASIKGVGACPLIPARFGPLAEWAWAPGPLIQAMNEIRYLNELRAKRIKNIDFSIDPPITFPDDSFVNIEDGIEGGKAYSGPARHRGDVKPLYTRRTGPTPRCTTAGHRAAHQAAVLPRLARAARRHAPDRDAVARSDDHGAAAHRHARAAVLARSSAPGRSCGSSTCSRRPARSSPSKVDGKVVTLLPYNPARRRPTSRKWRRLHGRSRSPARPSRKSSRCRSMGQPRHATSCRSSAPMTSSPCVTRPMSPRP